MESFRAALGISCTGAIAVINAIGNCYTLYFVLWAKNISNSIIF